MGWWRQIVQVLQWEAGLFTRFPKLRWSGLGICVIPALYAFIYLESVWDPADRTEQLPALIVNLDRGAQLGDQRLSIGQDVTHKLQESHLFGFRTVDDAQAARREVRSGAALFALLIPEDFTEQALAAERPGSGRLEIYASEGNNYTGAGFARRFAADLGRQVNETLSAKRWDAVLGASQTARESLQRLQEGTQQLHRGAGELQRNLQRAVQAGQQLQAGADRYAAAVASLTDGVKQLGTGVRALDARAPAAGDLQVLTQGAQQLAQGQQELLSQWSRLEPGVQQLLSGGVQLRDQSAALPLVGQRLADGAGQLVDGLVQLRQGLAAMEVAQQRLGTGALQLSRGVAQATDGFAQFSGGVGTLAGRWPPDAKLEELAQSGRSLGAATQQLAQALQQLQAGSQRLEWGLATLRAALPPDIQTLPGTPKGLAAPVEPQVMVDAPVSSNGMGFVPNFVPVALWLGAVMTAFIFHLRRLPVQAETFGRVPQLLGKLGVLSAINLVQALMVLLMAAALLGLRPVHLGGLAVTMVVSSLTFMLVILALVRVFGDVGKGVALILLIVQLSSAGGVVPIELTSDFYRWISPWLPFTWSVKAVRASAFGAFEHDWISSVLALLSFAAAAFAVGLLAGRWKFVEADEHRPAMDI